MHLVRAMNRLRHLIEFLGAHPIAQYVRPRGHWQASKLVPAEAGEIGNVGRVILR